MAEIDHRADIFAFGCVLYELVCGERAFSGGSIAETLSHIQHDEPESLREVSSYQPRGLHRILRKCLAEDPARRYQHADDIAVDLRDLGKRH